MRALDLDDRRLAAREGAEVSRGQIQYPGVGKGNGGERYEFRQVVLSKIGRLTPRWTAELTSMVSDEWDRSKVYKRRVQRALAWLRVNNRIRRTEDGYLLERR